MIENEMDNRGSKSNLTKKKNKFVKEQRVDGSYCITIYTIKVYS